MCDVYGEACFSYQNNLYKWTNSPVKKKVLVQRSIKKKVILTIFWDIMDFLEKGATINSASYYQQLEQNLP